MADVSRILIVDDEAPNRKLLETLLTTEGYRTGSAADGADALQSAATFHPDLILLDIMMPGIDGFEVASRLKADAATRAIPIIMVTALEDRDSRLRALEVGAEEFLSKPVDRVELSVRVRNLLRLREFHKFLEDHNRILEEQVAARTRELAEAYKDTIYTMVRASEFKDEETGAHVKRISHFCRDIATELGMDRAFTDGIFYASPMHDIGKIAVPDAVLLKPGGMTPEEWGVMKSHAAFGARILEKGSSPYTRMGAVIARSHHERWDGTGYPDGLRGEAIPFAARLMNIADQYDALRSKRPYKPVLPHERVCEIITAGDGRTRPEHFDPQVLAAFKRSAERWREIYDSMTD